MQNIEIEDKIIWDKGKVDAWKASIVTQNKKRNYGDVVTRVTRLPANTHLVEKYATMSDGNPAFRITVGDLKNAKPNILITGGVHGYEPSGVDAALRFAQKLAPALTKEFNFVVYPCLSPWSYEHDQRWNAQAEDPNRLFTRTPKAKNPEIFRTLDIEECRHFMNSIEGLGTKFTCAIDLHETCDRDVELRVLRSERFDEDRAPDYREIPQGYYLTLSKRETDLENRLQHAFGKSIIREVQKVSPIAPEATILNGKTNDDGLILSPPLQGSMRTYLDQHAKLVAVTEVYPDHENMTAETSVKAQIASINGALNYVRSLNF